jgi:hypothetical protein
MNGSSRVSPLRQRMIDDMRMRKLLEKTQSHYIRWVEVERFAAYIGRSPDTATVEVSMHIRKHAAFDRRAMERTNTDAYARLVVPSRVRCRRSRRSRRRLARAAPVFVGCERRWLRCA